MDINKKDAKSCINFFCETCNYKTNRKSSMDKHYSTSKHLKSIIDKRTQQKTGTL